MGFRFTYEGDEQELLGKALDAVVQRQESPWLCELTLEAAPAAEYEVLDARLVRVDGSKVTVGLVDDQDDYEPTGETRVLDLNEIRDVVVH